MLNIRRAPNGMYWIPRNDKETEDYLDSKYERVPNQLKWVSKEPSQLKLFQNIHQGEIAYIIGKGQSLDHVTQALFDTNGPIICINESIHKIEQLGLSNPTYCTQLDFELGETCKPKSAKLIIGPRCSNLYDKSYKYIIDPILLSLHDSCLSAQYVIQLAKFMGCSCLKLISFDGCLKQSYNYADCIGYSSGKGGPMTRFASHRPLIIETIRGLPTDWILPEAGGKITTVNSLV